MNPTDRLVIDASWVRGAHTQKGILVVRPHWAVFAPTEGVVNAAGVIAAGAVGAGAGFVVKVTPAQLANPRAWLTSLGDLDERDHDAHLWHAAHSAGWWVAQPGNAVLHCAKTFLFNRYKLYFRRGKEHVGAVFGVPGRLMDERPRLLDAWSPS